MPGSLVSEVSRPSFVDSNTNPLTLALKTIITIEIDKQVLVKFDTLLYTIDNSARLLGQTAPVTYSEFSGPKTIVVRIVSNCLLDEF